MWWTARWEKDGRSDRSDVGMVKAGNKTDDRRKTVKRRDDGKKGYRGLEDVMLKELLVDASKCTYKYINLAEKKKKRLIDDR